MPLWWFEQRCCHALRGPFPCREAQCRQAACPWRAMRAAPRNGLSTVAPRPITSASWPVTSVRPCVKAVAARSPAVVGMLLMALIRPHSSATASSIPSTPPLKANATSTDHRLSSSACFGSPNRTRSTLVRISPRVSVLRKKSSPDTEPYHAATEILQREPLRSSAMTSVSIR